jgi:hypothetical protein
MFFNKIINNLSIKNFLVASLLISSVGISQNSQAFPFVTQKTIINTSGIKSLLLVSAGILAIYLVIKGFRAVDRGPRQAGILENFNNVHHDYSRLKTDAKHELNDTSWFSPKRSLANNYATQWLEEDARSNKRHLFVPALFSDYYHDVKNRLQDNLKTLNDNPSFIEEEKEYDDKYREQDYRNDKARGGKIRILGIIMEIIQKGKTLIFG